MGLAATSGTSMTALERLALPVAPTLSARVMSPHRNTWLVLLLRLMFSRALGVYVVPWMVSVVLGDWSVSMSAQVVAGGRLVTQPLCAWTRFSPETAVFRPY